MRGIEVYVSGVVQGVGFRYFTRRVAREMGIKGYVKNLPDGRVYIIAVGEDAMLDKFISAIKKGPRLSVVKKVEISEVESVKFDDFEIRY
jgi:acylphosphatase